MGRTDKKEKKEKTGSPLKLKLGGIGIFITIIIIYSLVMLPVVLSYLYFIKFFDLTNNIHIIIFCFFITFEFLFFIICQTLIPGFFLKIFRFKLKDGEYDLYKDISILKQIFLSLVYKPPLTLLSIFKLIPLKNFMHKCAGMKIGKNCFIPDNTHFYEPYAIEIGENTLIGGNTTISAHSIENDKMIIKKVKIGSNVQIGGDAYIFSGVIIEDNVIVGARSLIIKNQILKKGKTYVGSPVKEI